MSSKSSKTWSAVSAGIGLLGGLLGSSAASKHARQIRDAYNTEADTESGLAQPYQEMNTETLPKLKSLLSQQYGSLSQTDPYLAAQHAQSLSNINHQTKAALASAAYEGATSPSAARGMALAANEGTTQAMNAENTSYGLNEERYKEKSLQNFMKTLGIGINLGKSGTSMLTNAASLRAQGVTGAAGKVPDAKSSGDSSGDSSDDDS